MRIVRILAILLALIIGTSLCGCLNDSKSEADELIKMLPVDYNGFVYVNFKNIEDSKYSSEYRSKILNALRLGNANGEKTGIYINKTKRMIFQAVVMIGSLLLLKEIMTLISLKIISKKLG